MELETRNSKLDTAAPLPELLRCPRCKESKPADEFGICRERKNGRNLYCKPCIRAKINAHRAALREYKAARLKRINQARSNGAGPKVSAGNLTSAAKPKRMRRPEPVVDEFTDLRNVQVNEISKQVAPAVAPALIARMKRSKLPIADRVFEVIKAGAHTYKEIYAVVKTATTSGDEIGEGIAKLLLTRGLIRTEIIDGTRHYFESEASPVSPKPNGNGQVKPAVPVTPNKVSRNGHALSFSALGDAFAAFAPVIRSASAAKLNSIREGG